MVDLMEKKMQPGERRYIVKVWSDEPRKQVVYGVYDRARGSWPSRRPGIGEIPLSTDTLVVQEYCDLLEHLEK